MMYFIEDALNGILMGSIYGLTALGLTIIFGVLKVVNFAHGSMLMVGMYIAFWTISLSGVHPYVALIFVIPVMYIFGYYLQDIVIKPIFKAEKNVREPLTVIIVTTGVWYILDNLTLLLFGPQYRDIQDNPLKGKMIEIGEIFISVPKLWGFFTAVVTAFGIYYFFKYTRTGRAIRATSLDRDAASLSGINQYKIYNMTFGIGAAVTGIAAVTLVPF
ncbi:MAG: ABC transporter permease, partial [Desulfobacterales bacterium RIFOXYA12_FULL_46_15]